MIHSQQLSGQMRSSSPFVRMIIPKMIGVKRNTKIVSVSFENRTSFMKQKPASGMVRSGVTSRELKTPFVFVRDNVNINQYVYLFMLKDKVVHG